MGPLPLFSAAEKKKKREIGRERQSGRERKGEIQRERAREHTHARLPVCERHQRSLNNFSGAAPFEGQERKKKKKQPFADLGNTASLVFLRLHASLSVFFHKSCREQEHHHLVGGGEAVTSNGKVSKACAPAQEDKGAFKC